MALRWNLITFVQLLGFLDKVGNNGFQKETFTGAHGSEEEGGRVEKRFKATNKEEDYYYPSGFQMPVHYPRYKKADYKNMEEWKLDMLLREYGLSFKGTLEEKRAFAIGTFLWPHQM